MRHNAPMFCVLVGGLVPPLLSFLHKLPHQIVTNSSWQNHGNQGFDPSPATRGLPDLSNQEIDLSTATRGLPDLGNQGFALSNQLRYSPTQLNQHMRDETINRKQTMPKGGQYKRPLLHNDWVEGQQLFYFQWTTTKYTNILMWSINIHAYRIINKKYI